MSIWALADLHLSFGVPNKEMHIFGEQWRNHPQKIAEQWRALVGDDDLVLLAGDISWGKHFEDALPDLEWIDALPGTKVMIKGNHDYWWDSIHKIRKRLPSSIHAIYNDAFHWKNVSIAGTRLWDSEEYEFSDLIDIQGEIGLQPPPNEKEKLQQRKIFQRELLRLEASLQQLDPSAEIRLVMTHYPPIGADLQPSAVSQLLERFHVNHCVFGHLHSVKHNTTAFGIHNHIHYTLSACDYLDFTPFKVL